MKKDFSLIIPTFNEEKRIGRNLSKLLNFLKREKSWEIIIINDGSYDGTLEILKKIQKRQKDLRVFSTKKNFGKGHAIRLGVYLSSGEFILFSDADFSVKPQKFLPIFLKELKKAQIVIGSRRLKTSRILTHQPIFREFLGNCFTKFANKFLGLNFSDITCGFKGFQRKAVLKIFSLQKINRWAFDAEILFWAKKLNFLVKEIPVSWKDDPKTKVRLIKDIVGTFWDLLRVRLFQKYV